LPLKEQSVTHPLTQLIQATCELAEIEMFIAQERPGEPISVALQYDDVQFVFSSDPLQPDAITGYCCFGELPPRRHESAMWRLLEMNLSNAASGWASFGIDASSHDVVYAFRVNPRLTSAVTLLQAIQALAGQAREWRNTCFLHAAEPGPPPTATPGQLAALA
jgi:hypothetical protein